MLASDVANPEFVNPKNPDAVLAAEFYYYNPVIAIDEHGRDVRAKEPVIYIRIQVPGRTDTIWEQAARDDHKRRFPNQWLAFQMREGMLETNDLPGTKLQDWSDLLPEQVRELTYLRFFTVEQIAGASDAQVQRMGISGMGLRERARQFLKSKMDQGVRDEIAARDKRIAELEAKMDALLAKPEQPQAQTETPKPKRKYTRKAKPEAIA